MNAVFLTNGSPSSAVTQRWLDADIESANLSAAYRIYYSVRGLVPVQVRWWLQRIKGSSTQQSSADWYLPERFYREFVAAIEQHQNEPPIIHPWPRAARFGLVLTHDVEGPLGVDLVPAIADLEEELGFRSSWNFVTNKYAVDDGLLRDLHTRGFEVGLHGYNHDGRLFSSRRMFRRRANAMNQSRDRFRAVGFRAPMVHRKLDWMQELAVDYDSSCFDVDPYQAMPGGVGSIWPFVVGDFVELPYTMPQDHTLFVTLGQEDDRVWQRKADWLIERNGMVLMLTHPDYLNTDRRVGAYRDILERLQHEPDGWHAVAKDVSIWWRQRVDSQVVRDQGSWQITGPAADEGRLASPVVSDNRILWSPL